MIIITVVLAWLGLSAGSFVNALVFRLHMQAEQSKAKSRKSKAENQKTNKLSALGFGLSAQNREFSILYGRSMCENCRHTLAWYDLIPLVSWLSLMGKCRYCKKPISFESPLAEITMALVFAGSYLLWPQTVHLNGQWLLLATWLIVSVGLLALAVYDLKWMLLPNRIIYPTLLIAATGRAGYIAFFEHHRLHAIGLWAVSVLIASGVFYLLYIISAGKWIGFGDVRLGFITGTLLALPQYSLLMIFLASLLGSLTAIPDLARGKKTLASRLPYGPFLITATGIAVVFGDGLISWYKHFFGL